MRTATLITAITLSALGSTVAQAAEFITVASTTSTQNSGLFGHILPLFTAKTGIAVRVVAVGTGQAIKVAKNGDADVLFVHHTPSERAFVDEGYGVKRHDVMMNDVYPCRTGYAEFGNDMWPAARSTRQQVLLCKLAGNRQAQVNVTQACGVDGWDGFRLPTLSEQRYLSYAPIVEGDQPQIILEL